MRAERIHAMLRAFPWIPQDYAGVLRRVEAGQRRYGLEWFDGPQPADAPGSIPAGGFPAAFRIGRRAARVFGYADVGGVRPALCEWAASQLRPVRRFAGIGELILSQRDEASDSRPIVVHELVVPGIAFGAWREAGASLSAPCILLPGSEVEGLNNLLDRLGAGWELTLVREDNDSWLAASTAEGRFELRSLRHGSDGSAGRTVSTRESAYSELAALAPFNDGAAAWCFGRLQVPRAG
jgi:hypothetical protein